MAHSHPMTNRLNTFSIIADLDSVAHAELEKIAERASGTDRHGRWICFSLETKIPKELVVVVKKLLSIGMSVRILEGDLIMAPAVDESGAMQWHAKRSRVTRAGATLKVKVPEPGSAEPAPVVSETKTAPTWKPGPRLLAEKFRF